MRNLEVFKKIIYSPLSAQIYRDIIDFWQKSKLHNIMLQNDHHRKIS